MIKGQAGLMTLDFIVALLVMAAFTAVTMALSFSLVVVEAGQYVAFASGRNFFAAHKTQQDQIRMADAKFATLNEAPAFKFLFDGTWFKLSKEDTYDFENDYASNALRNTFMGVRLNFSAPILAKEFPLVGGTGSNPDQFSAKLTAFLGREPSQEECFNFTIERWERIKTALSLGGSLPSQDDDYAPMADNGC